MPYKILVTKRFAEDFKKLKDKKMQETIKNKMEEVRSDPLRYKRLHYDLKGSFRIRTGPFRIIYSVDETKKELYLEKIVFGHHYR